MRDVLETNLIGDFRNRSVTSRVCNENLVSALQALGLDELTDRRLVVVEQAVEIAQGNPAAGSDLFRRQRLVAEMAFDKIDDSASQVIARIANVGCRAPVLGTDCQRDKADDFGCERLGIGRRRIDEQFRNASDHSHKQARHLLVRLEAPADMVFDGDETSTQFRRRNAHHEQARVLVGRELIEGEFAEQDVLAGPSEAGACILAECHASGQRKSQHIGSIMHIACALPVAGERPIRPDEFEIKAADPDLLLPMVCGFVVEADAFVARK